MIRKFDRVTTPKVNIAAGIFAVAAQSNFMVQAITQQNGDVEVEFDDTNLTAAQKTAIQNFLITLGILEKS